MAVLILIPAIGLPMPACLTVAFGLAGAGVALLGLRLLWCGITLQLRLDALRARHFETSLDRRCVHGDHGTAGGAGKHVH